jgi:hypothetical protein
MLPSASEGDSRAADAAKRLSASYIMLGGFCFCREDRMADQRRFSDVVSRLPRKVIMLVFTARADTRDTL